MWPQQQQQHQQILQIAQVSHDDDLQSLFNKCQSIPDWSFEKGHTLLDNKNERQVIIDLRVSRKQIQREYNSDDDLYMNKQEQPRRSRQVINKKLHRRTKKRNKIYIKVLENKVGELQAELQRVRKLNKLNKQYIHRLHQSEHVINGYLVGRQQVIQKLQRLNNDNHGVNSSKVLEQLVSLRLRQGVYGKDRIKAVNYYFREMIQMVLPEIQKYLIKTAIQNQDFFDINYLRTGVPAQGVEDWRKKMLKDIGSEIKQKNAKQYLYNNRSKLTQETEKFNEMLKQLGHSKCRLIQQAKKLQQVLDGAHRFMRPLEISKSLCYIDKYRFQKNILLQHTFKQVFQQMEQKDYSYEANKPFCIRT